MLEDFQPQGWYEVDLLHLLELCDKWQPPQAPAKPWANDSWSSILFWMVFKLNPPKTAPPAPAYLSTPSSPPLHTVWPGHRLWSHGIFLCPWRMPHSFLLQAFALSLLSNHRVYFSQIADPFSSRRCLPGLFPWEGPPTHPPVTLLIVIELTALRGTCHLLTLSTCPPAVLKILPSTVTWLQGGLTNPWGWLSHPAGHLTAWEF